MPDAKTNGFGWATREIVERTRAIARLEIELAILEVKRKLVRLGIGAGLSAGAAVLLFYAIGVLIAAAGAGLALVVPLWASLLIVGGVLLAPGRTARLAGGPLVPGGRAAGAGGGDRGGQADHRHAAGQ